MDGRSKKERYFLAGLAAMIGVGSFIFLRREPATIHPAMPALCSETLAAEGPVSLCPAYQPGEKLTYRVSWEKILLAGTAELSVKGGGTNLQFQLKAATSPSLAAMCSLQDDFLSTYDGILGAPVRYEKNFTLKQKTVKEIITFNQLGKSAQWMSPGRQTEGLNIEMGTQDPISSLYSVRNLGLKPGLRLIFPFVDGRKTYLLEVNVVNAELVSISSGTYNTLRTEVSWRGAGQPAGHRRMTLWLTNDTRKIPVLATISLPIGTGLVELISIT
jgi:hypothetical protein